MVTGSRTWTHREAVELELLARAVKWCQQVPGRRLADVSVVHGGCESGADLDADRLAGRVGFRTEVYMADWSKGRSGGPLRNQRMVNTRPDIVLAFNADTPGTTGCVEMARKAGLHVVQYALIQGQQRITQVNEPQEETQCSETPEN